MEVLRTSLFPDSEYPGAPTDKPQSNDAQLWICLFREVADNIPPSGFVVPRNA